MREFLDFLEAFFKVPSLASVINDENKLVDAFNEVFRVEGSHFRMTPVVKVYEKPGSSGDTLGRMPFLAGTLIRTVEYPKIITITEEVTYTESIVPALAALGSQDLLAANSEFRGALEDYRKGDFGDCLVKCGSCFESVLKVLCIRNNWHFKPNDTAKPLLELVVVGAGLEGFFTQPLLLIATMRNRLSSAHGGGPSLRKVEEYEANYCITSTAASVIFLIKACES